MAPSFFLPRRQNSLEMSSRAKQKDDKQVFLLRTACEVVHDDISRDKHPLYLDNAQQGDWEAYLDAAPIVCDMFLLFNESPHLVALPRQEFLPCGQTNIFVNENNLEGQELQISLGDCFLRSNRLISQEISIDPNPDSYRVEFGSRNHQMMYKPFPLTIHFDVTTFYTMYLESLVAERTSEGWSLGVNNNDLQFPTIQSPFDTVEDRQERRGTMLESHSLESLEWLIECELQEINRLLSCMGFVGFVLVVFLIWSVAHSYAPQSPIGRKIIIPSPTGTKKKTSTTKGSPMVIHAVTKPFDDEKQNSHVSSVECRTKINAESEPMDLPVVSPGPFAAEENRQETAMARNKPRKARFVLRPIAHIVSPDCTLSTRPCDDPDTRQAPSNTTETPTTFANNTNGSISDNLLSLAAGSKDVIHSHTASPLSDLNDDMFLNDYW